ncbi:DUF3107 domain-containing protein [Janibacter sp. GXQ6167]|uniref:DUF3107 domain-containing protein n=1 Tax=Janibacter sp. GXQ6167 TaxID=3240791 RepID=UPI003526A593
MEVKIGIRDVAREIVIESVSHEAEITRAIDAASAGEALAITDDKGRRIIVPAGALGYLEIGEPSRGRVGFGA